MVHWPHGRDARSRRHTAARPPPYVDEAAARRTLREQIARLEAQPRRARHRRPIRALPARARAPRPAPGRGCSGSASWSASATTCRRPAGAQAAEQGERQAAARRLLERMLLEPGRYKCMRDLRNEDIGEPGCKTWQSRPRLGLLGMLMGWWHVKISSGCPLPGLAALGDPR